MVIFSTWILSVSEYDFLKIDKNVSQLSRNHFYVSYDAVNYTNTLFEFIFETPNQKVKPPTKKWNPKPQEKFEPADQPGVNSDRVFGK